MNNCKKCGSGNIIDLIVSGEKKNYYMVSCIDCENKTGLHLNLSNARNIWDIINPEYKTILELRRLFEKEYFRESLDRNPGGEYQLLQVYSAWNGYLQCAKDNNLLPPDMDLLRERVK